MTTVRKQRFGWLVAGCMLLVPGATMKAQKRLPIGGSTVPPLTGTGSATSTPASDNGRGPGSTGLDLGLPDDSLDSTVNRNVAAVRASMANMERHRALALESDQLLRMVADLQGKIASNTSGLTHEEMLRQIGMIEKLAKDVKERMKGAR